VALPPEKLIELARDATLLGQKLFAEREVRYENLARTIRAFEEAQWYLESIEPKPDFYALAVSGLEESRRQLQQRVEDARFQADRAIKLRDWATAAGHLRDHLRNGAGPRRRTPPRGATVAARCGKAVETMRLCTPLAALGLTALTAFADTQVRVNTTPPGATLVVDGVARELAPTTLTDLKPGTHLVVARKDGFRETRASFALLAGQKLALDLKLEELRGLALIHASPTGAEIYHQRRLPRAHAPLLCPTSHWATTGCRFPPPAISPRKWTWPSRTVYR
jgi:hypothetical protein